MLVLLILPGVCYCHLPQSRNTKQVKTPCYAGIWKVISIHHTITHLRCRSCITIFRVSLFNISRNSALLLRILCGQRGRGILSIMDNRNTTHLWKIIHSDPYFLLFKAKKLQIQTLPTQRLLKKEFLLHEEGTNWNLRVVSSVWTEYISIIWKWMCLCCETFWKIHRCT